VIQEQFKIGSYWKKKRRSNNTWIIFRVIKHPTITDRIEVKPITHYGYGLYNFIVIGNHREYSFEELSKEDVLLELL